MEFVLLCFTMVDINREVRELSGVFTDVSRRDFTSVAGLDAIVVTYETNSVFEDFEIAIAFPPAYPDREPPAFVLDPDIPSRCPHIYEKLDDGITHICYIDPDEWSSAYTSYDAAVMIKSWVYAYCNWQDTGEWDWPEAH